MKIEFEKVDNGFVLKYDVELDDGEIRKATMVFQSDEEMNDFSFAVAFFEDVIPVLMEIFSLYYYSEQREKYSLEGYEIKKRKRKDLDSEWRFEE